MGSWERPKVQGQGVRKPTHCRSKAWLDSGGIVSVTESHIRRRSLRLLLGIAATRDTEHRHLLLVVTVPAVVATGTQTLSEKRDVYERNCY